MALDLVQLLVGSAPSGLEYLEYVTATIFGLFAVKFVLEMFYVVLNIIKK